MKLTHEMYPRTEPDFRSRELAQLRLGDGVGIKFPMMAAAGSLFKPTPKIDSPISILRPFHSGQYLFKEGQFRETEVFWLFFGST